MLFESQGENMKIINRLMLVLMLALLVQGCSRPGKSTVKVEEDKFFYSFVAEDGALLGLSVTDSAEVAATETQPGVYQFAVGYVPTPPIRFVSRNQTEPGSSFQDVNGDGQRTGADIDYNGMLEIAYIGNFTVNSEREIFANPLTALIPSNGIPSDGIGGLPQQVFEIAISNGVANAPTTEIQLSEDVVLSAKAIISRSVALISALQEGIFILEGAGTEAMGILDLLSSNLRDANLTTGLANPTEFATAIQSSIESSVSQQNLDAVISLSQLLGTLVNESSTELVYHEAMVKLVQDLVVVGASSADLTTLLTNSNLIMKNNSLVFSVKLEQEIAESGGLSTFLSSLRLVPIPIGENGMSLVDNSVSDFAMSLVTESSRIQMSAVDAFFDQTELTYYFEDDLYGAKVDDDHAILVTLNANETNLLGAAFEGTNAVRLLALCWRDVGSSEATNQVCGEENSNLEFYALATEEEICGSGFESLRDEVLLAHINQLNSSEITCNQ
jgi:hypothetical protein